MLQDLGVQSIRLFTNNPLKIESLEALGVSITARIPLQPQVTTENATYLLTKVQRMRHLLDLDPPFSSLEQALPGLESVSTRAVDHRRRHGRPFVTLSYAQSLDGCIAACPGQALSLSGPQSLKLTHYLRAAHDAILVGIGTILADNPLLNVRLVQGKDPQPLVVDSRLRFPLEANLLQHHPLSPWIATSEQADVERQRQLEAAGARIIRLPSTAAGDIDLHALLAQLGAWGVNSLMVEGGARIITSFLAAQLVDHLVLHDRASSGGRSACRGEFGAAGATSFPRVEPAAVSTTGRRPGSVGRCHVGQSLTRRALYFTAPSQVSIRTEGLCGPAPGQVLVQTLVSAISPGTELLIYRGQAPTDLAADETIAALTGNLTFPLKYGYAAVGRVTIVGSAAEAAWQDRLVFAFHPHESHFLAAPAELFPVPPALTPEEAVFLPNMETAVNFLMDGHPLIGERVVVFGQGVVGLLTTALLARLPLGCLLTLDRYAQRRGHSLALGAQTSLEPDGVLHPGAPAVSPAGG